MRTATIIAETHDGKEILLFGRKTPIHEQLGEFRKLLGLSEHPEYAAVHYQDSDSGSRTVKFKRPEIKIKSTATKK